MITPATAKYLEYEAQKVGATPIVKVTLLPYYYPVAIDGDGTFVNCAYVLSPGGVPRIQATYAGFTSGSWISAAIFADTDDLIETTVTWTESQAGFETVLYWRTANTAAELATASWQIIQQDDVITVLNYHQFKWVLTGYRAWAEDDPGDADDFTAWAEDMPNEDEYQGYAAPGLDDLTYIEAISLSGEYNLIGDIESAGNITQEIPAAFDELVAGNYSGLTLNNRQGAWVGGVWVPAPRYSPNKSSFIFAGQDWYGKEIKVYLGWGTGGSGSGWGITGFGEAPGFLMGGYSEWLPIFHGKIITWGPVTRAVDEDGKFQPNTVEIYARDYLHDLLATRIAIPAADGTPQPLTYGEFLVDAEPIGDWSPDDPVKEIDFESGDYSKLDSLGTLNGGTYEIITPGMDGNHAFRCSTDGASTWQRAYGTIILGSAETLIRGHLRFSTVPASVTAWNMIFLRTLNAARTELAYGVELGIGADGMVWASIVGATLPEGKCLNLNVPANEDIWIPFSVWFAPKDSSGPDGYDGQVKIWINGEEVYSFSGNLANQVPYYLDIGVMTGNTAETWTVDFNDIQIYSHYYRNAFRVTGAPFTSIGSVYIDQAPQGDTQIVPHGSGYGYIQTLTRYPEWGMVQFTLDDEEHLEFTVDGNVQMRVVEQAGGRHALEIIEALLTLAGLDSYIDAAALAAAYAACPNDIINVRFDPGGTEKRGLKDYSSLGMTVGDALKEILVRCLYWIFFNFDSIKIVPYTGAAPTGPVLPITAANAWECDQIIDMEKLNAYVGAKYGWYERDNSLFYLAGTAAAGNQGTELDLTWASPVCVETYAVVKAKADLLLQYLGVQERVEPVKIGLQGVRVELMDVVSLNDALLHDTVKNYWVTRKEVNLDSPIIGGKMAVALTLADFLEA